MKQLKEYRVRLRGKLAERRTYFKILFSITGCTLTAVLLLSGVLYRSSREMLAKQSITLSMQSFAQIQSITDTLRATAGAVATQLLLDDASASVLLASHGEQVDSFALYKTVRQLTLYRNMHESIDSIYLYNSDIDTLVTSEVKSVYEGVESFYDAQLLELLKSREKADSKVLIKRRVQKSYENGYTQDRDVYTYIVPNMYDGDRLKSAVVVNISADWLVRQLVETQNLENSMMVVFDNEKSSFEQSDDPLIELNGLSDIPRSAFKEPFLHVLEDEKTYAECKWNGEKYFISYLYSPRLGWHFVKVSRWDTVFAVLEQLRSGVIILVACIVGVCLGGDI